MYRFPVIKCLTALLKIRNKIKKGMMPEECIFIRIQTLEKIDLETKNILTFADK